MAAGHPSQFFSIYLAPLPSSQFVVMSKQACSELGGGPSVKERIQALYDHRDRFGKIAEFPQAGVYLTVPEDLVRVRAYVESEVFRCRRAVNCYLQKSVQPGEPSPTETTHREVMMPYVEAVLLFGLYTREFGVAPIADRV